MDLEELLEHFNNGETLGTNREYIEQMRYYSRESQKLTMEINTKYHEPEELSKLFSEVIGKPVGEGFGLFPPFYTDFGKNITIGKNVFINAGCKFQLPQRRDSSFIQHLLELARMYGLVQMLL